MADGAGGGSAVSAAVAGFAGLMGFGATGSASASSVEVVVSAAGVVALAAFVAGLTLGLALTSGFGMRFHPVLGGRHQHKGIDLAQPVGSPVYATADGVVGRADWFSSYGLFISLEHGGNIETRYGHLSRLNVAAGQAVHKGDLIGYVGTTGRSTGPHLHYEVRIAGVAVNPVPYLQGGVQTVAAPSTLAAIGGGEDDGE